MTLTERKSRPVGGSASVSETAGEKQDRKAKEKALAAPYEPTPREKTALDAYRARKAGKSPSPSLKATKAKGTTSIAPDHPDIAIGGKLLMGALGTTSPDFYEGLLTQLVSAGSKGQEPNERDINFMLSVVKGIEPRDEIEAMLAAQMAAVHMASMTFARRLAHVDTIPQQDSAERAFNKLARTFTTQIRP
jgi:hypothetical protein